MPIALVMLAWLLVCAILDMRTHRLPLWLTVAPFVPGILWAALSGRLLEAIAALLVVFAPDIAERIPSKALTIMLGILALIGVLVWALLHSPATIFSILAMVYLLVAWLGKGMGGADVLVQITIILLAGFEAFLVVVIVTGVYALLVRIQKRRAFPAMVPIFLGTAIWFTFIF